MIARSGSKLGLGFHEHSLDRIDRETVTYVSNIYKYYVAYRLVLEEQERRTAAREELESTRGAAPDSQ